MTNTIWASIDKDVVEDLGDDVYALIDSPGYANWDIYKGGTLVREISDRALVKYKGMYSPKPGYLLVCRMNLEYAEYVQVQEENLLLLGKIEDVSALLMFSSLQRTE